jgi:integrase
MLRIPAEAEKGDTNREYPMSPEFAELLATVPEGDRFGWVFRPMTKQGDPMSRSRHSVGKRVSEVGKGAGVVTGDCKRRGKTVTTFAGAHDLRRAFGVRWAKRVEPFELKEIMRHETLAVTLQYYVGKNARSTAASMRRAVENEQGESLSTLLSTPGPNAKTPKHETSIKQ